MKRTLAIVAVLTLSACGTSAVRSSAEPGRATEPESGSLVGDPTTTTAYFGVDSETGAQPVDDEPVTGSTVGETSSSEQPAAEPPPAISPTTIPGSMGAPDSTPPGVALDFDLSDLDGLLSELDRLMGDLGSVMNQTEGETTP